LAQLYYAGFFKKKKVFQKSFLHKDFSAKIMHIVRNAVYCWQEDRIWKKDKKE